MLSRGRLPSGLDRGHEQVLTPTHHYAQQGGLGVVGVPCQDSMPAVRCVGRCGGRFVHAGGCAAGAPRQTRCRAGTLRSRHERHCLSVCLLVCGPVPCAHSTRVPVCLSGCVGACRGPFGPVLSSDVLPMLSGCVQVKIYQATAKGATEPAAAANATKAALGTMRLPLPCLTRACRLYASLHRLRRGPSRGV